MLATLRTTAVLVTVTMFNTLAQATELYYESFSEPSYPISVLGTSPNLGGAWATVQGTPSDAIIAGSLSTAGTLARPAVGGKLNFDNVNSRATSTLSAGVGADGTTIYSSFLLDIPGTGGTFFTGLEMWNGVPSGATNRAIRAGWTGNQYAVQTDTGTGSVALDAGLNFVVLEFDYLAGDDQVNVFVNPQSINDILTGVPDGILTGGNFCFDRFGLADFNDVNLGGFVDEIRVGTTVYDVVSPEPASIGIWALIGVGLVGFGMCQ